MTEFREACVLVADDDDLLRSTLRFAVEFHGHAVEEAADGDACLQLLLEHAFDLVIMDAHMPGAALGQRLRTVERRGVDRPRVVVLTGLADTVSEDASMIDRLVQKPLRLSALTDLLADLPAHDAD